MANEAADQEGRKFEVFRQIKGRALGCAVLGFA
jgi:hypothetical protein